jgi:hypothetical protein
MVDRPAAAQALFLRLQREPLTAPESPALLTLPADGPWIEAGPPQPEEPTGTPATLPWP